MAGPRLGAQPSPQGDPPDRPYGWCRDGAIALLPTYYACTPLMPHHDPAPTDQAVAHPDAVEATGVSLRAALRAVASPVVVVTAAATEGPRGATIGSFTSVALDPPLVSFYVTQGTRFHDALHTAERVAVHLLEAGQADVASRFAIPDLDGPEQLDGIAHVARPDEPPVLAGTLGVLHGRVARRIPFADHTLVLVRVERIVPGVAGEPLLYYRQSYRGVGRAVS